MVVKTMLENQEVLVVLLEEMDQEIQHHLGQRLNQHNQEIVDYMDMAILVDQFLVQNMVLAVAVLAALEKI